MYVVQMLGATRQICGIAMLSLKLRRHTHHSKEASSYYCLLLGQTKDQVSLLCVLVDL